MRNIHPESPKILEIQRQITRYPSLAVDIRRRMRDELFHRGIVTHQYFHTEVNKKTQLSRQGDGGHFEKTEEYVVRWNHNYDALTDFYFAYNLPIDLFYQIIDDLLMRQTDAKDAVSTPDLPYNPEIMPLEIVLKQAERYEALSGGERIAVDNRLRELYVVLLRNLVSDQLAYLTIARRWFTTQDFNMILERRIGTGKIGGKSAGLLLAYKILQSTAPEIFENIFLPRSYFIGTDVFSDFQAINKLEFLDRKYRTVEQIRAEYPEIKEQFASAHIPEEITHQLREVVREMGNTPLIVRSSSLLEDNFGLSFAGKYTSMFLPNQGTFEENLRALMHAIRLVYASVLGPDVLIYRRRNGLLDYDERMAILLQEVQGGRHGQYYYPTLAGVAYSFSPVVWNMRQKREEGFIRLVMGLGTRATDRITGDYPRMINLSHPLLRPELTPQAIRHYSQHFIDALDLEQNTLNTIPVESVLVFDTHLMRLLASVDDGDMVRPLLSMRQGIPTEKLILTFDGLLRNSLFVPLLKTSLKRIAEEYKQPIDLEFAVSFISGNDKPKIALHLLQCRPQNQWGDESLEIPSIPRDLAVEDKILVCTRMVPQGYAGRIEYIVYVDADAYNQLSTYHDRSEVVRWIGKLNNELEGSPFILVGTGRWGTSDFTQGVPVTYMDIFNASALVEVSGSQKGFNPEPSYGTHFYQDLVESRIYPLTVQPDEPGDYLNRDFIRNSENQIGKYISDTTKARYCIKVIHITKERPGYHMEIVMDGQSGWGYLMQSNTS